MNSKTALFRVGLGASTVIAALVLNLGVSSGVCGQGGHSGGSNEADICPWIGGGISITSAAHASGSRPNALPVSPQPKSTQSQASQPQSGSQYGQPQRLEASRLTVKSKGGKLHTFTVEVARTPKEQEIGMMFRKSVEPDAGMLFLFSEPRPAAFWMYNTYIPLDLIFIDKTGRIESIAPNAAPHSLKPRQSRGAVVGVLEIAGGRSAELGIVEGDEILHPEIPRR